MFGFFLAIFGSFLSETSLSIGKTEIKNKKEDIFSFIFLGLFFNFLIFIILSLVQPANFIFSLKSLPTFSVRLILEIVQVYVAAVAIAAADRTTYGLMRTVTIPLLLLVDVFLGYSLHNNQIIGILILCFGMIIAFIDKTVSKKGLLFVIISALNAVITISLYKYDITHFNSFIAEQLIVSGTLWSLSLLYLTLKEKINPFLMLTKKYLLFQSLAEGFAGAISSFAYTFLPASIILAITRASSISFATIFGKVYFKEKHILHKIAIVAVVIIGFIFLMN